MFKKSKKLILICFLLIMSLLCIYYIDFTLVSKDKKPIFVISGPLVKDGGTREYYGLGYKVICWNQIAVQQVNGKETVGFFKGYEISIFPNYQNISDGPKKELEFVSKN